MYGAHVYRLNVHIVERANAEDAVNGRSSSRMYHNYWIASRDGFVGRNEWIRAVIPLPLLTSRYIVEIQRCRQSFRWLLLGFIYRIFYFI